MKLDEPRSRKKRRLGRRLLVLLSISLVALTALVLFGARTKTGRGVVLGFVGARIESALGVRATARDFSLSLRAGRIVVWFCGGRSGG